MMPITDLWFVAKQYDLNQLEVGRWGISFEPTLVMELKDNYPTFIRIYRSNHVIRGRFVR